MPHLDTGTICYLRFLSSQIAVQVQVQVIGCACAMCAAGVVLLSQFVCAPRERERRPASAPPLRLPWRAAAGRAGVRADSFTRRPNYNAVRSIRLIAVPCTVVYGREARCVLRV